MLGEVRVQVPALLEVVTGVVVEVVARAVALELEDQGVQCFVCL